MGYYDRRDSPSRVLAMEEALEGNIDARCAGSVPHFLPPLDFAF